MKPGGKYVMQDLDRAGGIPMVMKELLKGGFLHGDVLTVTGKTVAENLAAVEFNPNQLVVQPITSPRQPQRWAGCGAWQPCAARRGVKIVGLDGHTTHHGPARVFDSEDLAFAAVQAQQIKKGDVIVIRYEGRRVDRNA